MRRTLLALIAASLLFVQASVKADDLAYTRFGDFLEALRVQAGIPGMVAAVVGRSAVQWERVFGTADLDKNIPTRIDTPFHLDGLTEVFSASLLLRCVEEGRVSLDDLIGQFAPDSVDASLTVRQVLTHTSGPADNPLYQFRPDRLEPLSLAIEACREEPYRKAVGRMFDVSGMFDSVPGADVTAMPRLVPPAEWPGDSALERYTAALTRLAVPYAVDLQTKRVSPSQYTTTTLTTATGAISTVQDLEKFDLSLKNGILLKPETIAMAQRAPTGATGQKLPHAIGWFAQNYLGENVYWQFGMTDNGGSALMVIWPTRSLTFIVLANSNGLAKPFNLAAGDLRATPFGKLFLNLFIR